MRKIWIGLIASTALAACGGGGGGDSEDGPFAGKWDFEGTKYADTCNSGFESSVSTRWTVKQDGNVITVETEDLTITGYVKPDGSGWAVSGTRPSECAGGTDAYAISSIIDEDNGTAGVGLVVRCGGVSCALEFGGTMTRSGKKSLDSEDSFLKDQLEAMGQSLHAQG